MKRRTLNHAFLFPIDKGIPLPGPRPRPNAERHAARRTLLAMEVGDSIFCHDRATRDRFHYAINYIRRRRETALLRFSIRMHETGWRVWRLD
ncbi:MAG: hypothetical protein JSS20_18500 [Proteobacteria bacterium]|nr:hypothetical protein [Pseudomonadota bacterium]